MFKLKIETKNDAFEDDIQREIIHCLRDVIERLNLVGYDAGNIHDSNGNKVGTFTLTKWK